MKLALAALITAACTTCTPAPRENVVLDPLTTDAAAVDEVHRTHRRAVCVVSTETALQLCADKGFDGVTFASGADAVHLRKRAGQLGLPEITAPSGSADSRTTNGS